MILFEPGDEVIVPALTHVATAHAVELAGCRPVFVDCGPEGNITRHTITPAITKKTAGVIAMHYLGYPADLGDLKALCRKHGLKLLEDCALSLGSRIGNTHTGLWGDAGCFSFYAVKHITTAGEGGMLLTKDSLIADAVRRRRSFGQAAPPSQIFRVFEPSSHPILSITGLRPPSEIGKH